MKIRNINKILNIANNSDEAYIIYYNLKNLSLSYVRFKAFQCIYFFENKNDLEVETNFILKKYLEIMHDISVDEVKNAKKNEDNGIKLFTNVMNRDAKLTENDIYNLCDINNVESYAEAAKAGVPVSDILA